MLREYIQAAMRRAKYEILPDDGSYYAETPELDNVFASAATWKAAAISLQKYSKTGFSSA